MIFRTLQQSLILNGKILEYVFGTSKRKRIIKNNFLHKLALILFENKKYKR
jgi:hypothetical protein